MKAIWFVAGVLLLAGCFGPGPDAGDEQQVPCPPECPENHIFSLVVELDAPGTHSVGVPFAHGNWCLAAQDWSVTPTSPRTRDAVAEVRQVEGGTILWVTSTGHGRFYASVDLENRSECQTFGYDPWGIEPEPADGTVVVLADGSFAIWVDVEHRQGSCTDFTSYRGMTSNGWTNIVQFEELTRCT